MDPNAGGSFDFSIEGKLSKGKIVFDENSIVCKENNNNN